VVIALLGAMLLSVTFVPAAVALFIGGASPRRRTALMAWARAACTRRCWPRRWARRWS
jgi:cobalt-zinc-cadmium resistance protein CzcA